VRLRKAAVWRLVHSGLRVLYAPLPNPLPILPQSNYTCAGTGDEEEYTTLFVQYAFQYIQITGWPHGSVPNIRSLTAWSVHAGFTQVRAR
jgi:hypothetical protein